jgi:hypothetical protein
MNLFWRLLLAIEMIFWHNLQIKITTETEDTLRTDITFCGDMAIWEQETGVLYQVTCLDYSCVICWLFNSYLILFK